MALDHVLQGLEHLLSLKYIISIGTAGTITTGGRISLSSSEPIDF